MADTDTPSVVTLHPLPSSQRGEGPRRDATAAVRARRYRKRRKTVPVAVTRPEIQKFEKANDFKAGVTVGRDATVADNNANSTSGMAPTARPEWQDGGAPVVTAATLVAALTLATVSAGFSISGLTSIFVGSFWPVIAMGVALEAGKLSAVAWLGQHRGRVSRGLKGALITLVAVLMALNAIGAYGFLAKAHIGHAVGGEVASLARGADVDARLNVQAGIVADIDRRIAQIDSAVEKATSKGRAASAMALADQQRRARTELATERVREAKALATLEVEKAKVAGERRTVEADLGPVKYLATLIGAGDQDVLRWFILVVALLLDPAAVLMLLAAAQARR